MMGGWGITAGRLLRGAATASAVCGLFCAALLLAPAAATAQEVEDFAGDGPALITADELTYEEELGIVTASGNVEIAQGTRILLADNVSYNQTTEVVTAAGNVSLLNENGDVYFSEYAELTGDLQEGFIQGVRALLADGVTRVAAARGIRTSGNRTVFEDSVYSPCEPCRENPEHPPLWQLSARKVIHDKEAREVRYRDATFDIFGVPVFYTPYFEHPDPTVRRKSGLLTPSFKSSDFLGLQASIPYYWAIDDNVDVTITPTLTTEQNPYLNLEYRQLFPNGSISIQGSGTIADRQDRAGKLVEDTVRGHIDASGRFTLNSRWRTGFDVFRLTDDTYDQLYDVPVPETRARVKTNAFLEGFGGRNYFAANTFAYQSLRSNEDDALQPFVVPELDFSYLSEPLIANSLISADANLLYLTREKGRQVARASLVTGWTLPYTSDWGDVWTLRGTLQTDGYWTEGNDASNPNAIDPVNPDGGEAAWRAFPQASIEWRYPWVVQSGGWEQIIEPIGQFVAAPNGQWFNRGGIPNEDSLDFEFDDTTLFASSRFPGVDRVDTGLRASYGLQYSVYSGRETFSQLFLGQSWRLSETDIFAEGSGIEDSGPSDIVGRVVFSPIQELYTAYRFRLDQDTLDPQLHEVSASAGNATLRLGVNYTYAASQQRFGGFGERETATVSASSRLTENWSMRGSLTQDFVADQLQKADLSLTYADECLLLSVTAQRRNFEDRDLEPDTRFFLTIGLAQLGQFQAGLDGGSGDEE